MIKENKLRLTHLLIVGVLSMIMIINLNAKESDIVLEPIIVKPDENK